MPIDINQVMQWYGLAPLEKAALIRSQGKLKGMPHKRRPICHHRGKLLDVTACKCSVWACAIHSTCSNSARSGLKLCQGCTDYRPKVKS